MLRTQSKGQGATPRLNYAPTDRAFDSTQMPDRARKAREEVLKSLTGKRLTELKPQWNPCTGAGRRGMPERPLQATLHEVRPCVTCRHHHQHDHAKLVYNFRAETIPKPSATSPPPALGSSLTFGSGVSLPRCRELPNSPELDGKTQWNGEMQVDQRLRSKVDEERRKKVLEASKKRIQSVNTNYVSPENLLQEQKRQQRRRKEEELAERARLVKLYGPNYEDVLERIRRRDEIRDKNANRPEWLQRQRRVTQRVHTGAWQKMPDGTEAWSCCLCSSRDGDGCQTKTKNLDKWHVESL